MQREWRRFCDVVMQQPGLTDDERFRTNPLRLTNRDVLEALIEERFRSHTQAEVMTWLTAAGIATASVNDVPAVAAPPTARRAPALDDRRISKR